MKPTFNKIMLLLVVTFCIYAFLEVHNSPKPLIENGEVVGLIYTNRISLIVIFSVLVSTWLVGTCLRYYRDKNK